MSVNNTHGETMKQLLSDALDDYTRFRKSQDISKATITSHGSVLRRFLTVNGNIYCDKIADRHVTRYFEEASKTRQPITLRNDHVALSVFFDWCRHTRRMEPSNNPMYGRRPPRGTKRERHRVPVTDFPRLLDAAEARCERDRAVIALLLYTLLRDQEVADLRIRDVDLNGGWLTARIHKTRQEDLMPISEELDGELRRWLAFYAAEAGELQPNWRLVPARRVGWSMGEGGRFTQQQITQLKPERAIGKVGRIVNPVLEDIGFTTTDINGKGVFEGAHTIRRSGARALFDSLVSEGYDYGLRVVQSMLHHSSVTTTETYIGISADRRSRNDLIRGRKMYATTGGSNVVQLAR